MVFTEWKEGRDLWRSPCPTPLLKQGHLDLVAQDHVQMVSEYLQGREENQKTFKIQIIFSSALLCWGGKKQGGTEMVVSG